jgi:hypothetical protein
MALNRIAPPLTEHRRLSTGSSRQQPNEFHEVVDFICVSPIACHSRLRMKLSKLQNSFRWWCVFTLIISAQAQPISETPYAADTRWHIDSKAEYALFLTLYAVSGEQFWQTKWVVTDFPRVITLTVGLYRLPPGTTKQSLARSGFEPVFKNRWRELGLNRQDGGAGIELDLDGKPGFEANDRGQVEEYPGEFQTPRLPEKNGPHKIRARWRAPSGEYIVAESFVYVGFSTGVSIANGATFTNDLKSKLSLIAPGGSAFARISNDGGFSNAKTFEISDALQKFDWTMATDYLERSTRNVYVRFLDSLGGLIEVASDSIIYDPEPPKIVEALLTEDGLGPSRKANSSRNLTLRTKARDNLSGVDNIEIRRWGRPDKTQVRKFTPRISLPRNLGGVSVRVSDRAGNWSAWRDLRRPGAETKGPVLSVTSPRKPNVTTSAARFTLKAKVTDNATPRSLRYRVRGPKDKGFGKWRWTILTGNQKSKEWRQAINLARKGLWRVQLQAYDAEGNGTGVREVTVTRK